MFAQGVSQIIHNTCLSVCAFFDLEVDHVKS